MELTCIYIIHAFKWQALTCAVSQLSFRTSTISSLQKRKVSFRKAKDRSMYYAVGNKTQSSGEMSRMEKDYLKKNKPKQSIFCLAFHLPTEPCTQQILSTDCRLTTISQQLKGKGRGGQVFFQADEGWEDSGDFPAEMRKP